MSGDLLCRPLVLVCVASLTFGSIPQAVLSQTEPISGSIAGSVFDKSTRVSLEGVIVSAQKITTNERFTGQATDARGSYLISPVPPGLYVFYLEHEGIEYAVTERFDLRTGVDFLMEGCFQLDRNSLAAELIPDCKSGAYAESQVVSLGPHRFYLPVPSPPNLEAATPAVAAQDALVLTHSAVECIANDQHSILGANVRPGDQVQSCRVYFRAAQHPDFYYVEMDRVGAVCTGTMPMPSPETAQVIYYIEAVDLGFNPAQSGENIANVTASGECRRRDPGAAYFTGEDPGIIVGATVAGASAIPLGFQAAGIAGFISAAGAVSTAAAVGAAAVGAGIGTLGIVLIVAGGAAAAGGIVAATTGEKEASPIQ